MNTPEKIRLNRAEKILQLLFADNQYLLPAEYLRVYSPSAEVRGHGSDDGTLISGKMYVGITRIMLSGRYALQIVFDDGHDTGLYTWDYLRELGEEKPVKWQTYLDRLQCAGLSRDPDESTVTLLTFDTL